MALPELLNDWRHERQFAQSVAAWKVLPARAARAAEFPTDLHPQLGDALRRRGIPKLYSHQLSAWRAAQNGKHIVVVTGTASGKTLCYNLPVLDELLRQPDSRALYLFPTKALAQDQADEVRGILGEIRDVRGNMGDKGNAGANAARLSPLSPLIFPNLHSPIIATYDGDTPTDQRPAIRNHARIVITNPDMLHTGILPHHTKWQAFFEQLRFVVIDELHALRGVFGSHVANVMRRLKRIANFYGASPQFIMASATIANPIELAERIVEETVTLIDDDGAPRGEKHFIIYNPPVVNKDLGLRRSAVLEAVRLGNQLLNHDVQTILFARSRQTVELTLNYLQQSRPVGDLFNQATNHQTTHPTLRAYRGGYLPSVRREIERGLREGEVRGVVATNALELGVDIGQMGASVMVGYPGNIAATWQQAGRAGRTSATSLALLVASAAPIDQYLAHHPSWFFGRTPEHGLINPDNLIILLHHLRCAAFELPFVKGESFGNIEGGRVKEFLDFLTDEGVLHPSNEKYFWMSEKYPADSVSLRSASPDTVVIQHVANPHPNSPPFAKGAHKGRDDDTLPLRGGGWAGDGGFLDEPPAALGEVDLHSAFWMLHPQAIYMHEGQQYFVAALDMEKKIAQVHRVSVDYYTEAKQEVTIELSEQFAEAEVCGGTKAHGEIKVTSQVTGFKKIKLFTHEILGAGLLEMPSSELLTTGYWLTVSDATVERLRALGLWRADPNDYGPNWQELRRRTRERDAFRCQNCGVKENGTEHHVHHKLPFKTFANHQLANQLLNLVTLCPSCHMKVELAVHVRSSLAGLSFVLGHLAPLFLMCDRRDVGVHSDPKSPLSNGQPTVVIYDQVPAGIGLSERLYELHDDLLARAHELVTSCDCLDGCPSCVGPAGESGEGAKQQTVALIEALSDNARRRAAHEHN